MVGMLKTTIDEYICRRRVRGREERMCERECELRNEQCSVTISALSHKPIYIYIRESTDSLCRDGTDTPIIVIYSFQTF